MSRDSRAREVLWNQGQSEFRGERHGKKYVWSFYASEMWENLCGTLLEIWQKCVWTLWEIWLDTICMGLWEVVLELKNTIRFAPRIIVHGTKPRCSGYLGDRATTGLTAGLGCHYEGSKRCRWYMSGARTQGYVRSFHSAGFRTRPVLGVITKFGLCRLRLIVSPIGS